MKIRTVLKDTGRIAKFSTVIIFLALIRCVSEPFRLQYYSTTEFTFGEIKPFLIGSLVAALGLFAMTVLFYFGRYKLIIVFCVLTIVILLIIKKLYLLP
jgi:hypothetical protein